ncbi:MAG: DUF3618 domain-containing protein [Nocardioides sp.]
MSTNMSSLESELEATRNQLADTIDQLVNRVSPKTIMDRQLTTTKAHFVAAETGRLRTDNVTKVVGGVVGFVAVLAIIRKLTR